MELSRGTINDRMDQIEELMLTEMEPANPTTLHLFYPGLYKREILMKKGMLLSSRIHKTTHPFFVLTGKCSVVDEDGNQVLIQAPHCGMTEPGTRRILAIHEDCHWVTIHAVPYLTGEENGWSPEAQLDLVHRIEKDLLEDRESSISGEKLYLKHRERIKDLGQKLTY